MRHAELVLPASHFIKIFFKISEHQRHIFYFFLQVRGPPLLPRRPLRLAEALEFFGADFSSGSGLDLLPDLRAWRIDGVRRHVDGVDRSRLLRWKQTVRKNAIRRFRTLTQSLTNLWAYLTLCWKTNIALPPCIFAVCFKKSRTTFLAL